MIHPIVEVMIADGANEIKQHLIDLNLHQYGNITLRDIDSMLTRWYLSQYEFDDLDADSERYEWPIYMFFPYGDKFNIDEDLGTYLSNKGVPLEVIQEDVHEYLWGLSRDYGSHVDWRSQFMNQYDDRWRIEKSQEGDMTTLTLIVDMYEPEEMIELDLPTSVSWNSLLEIQESLRKESLTSVSLRTDYYNQLKDSIVPGSGFSDDALIFMLIRRYMSLGGLNYQSEIPDSLFDLLYDTFKITHEAFASPINRYRGTVKEMTYSSLYPEIDQWFGALSTYRDSDIVAFEEDVPYMGIEANPPFTEQMMTNLADYIQLVFDSTDKGVTFAVIIPTWTDSRGYKQLLESPYLTYHLDISRGDHQYRVGSYYLNQSRREYVSLCNSTLFILQNQSAINQYPVPDDFTDQLLNSFICQ